MLNDLLNVMGFIPTSSKNSIHTFSSPFNPEERTPSFHTFSSKVESSDPLKGVNFSCKSTGNGGDIYKFIQLYYGLSFMQSKEKVAELLGLDGIKKSDRPTSFSFNQQRKPSQSRASEIKITDISTLKHVALIDYISSRGIDVDIARRFLGEVRYKADNNNFFALAFYNDNGGMEIRSKYFKGSLGKKDISLIRPMRATSTLKIFEGFMDFLSYLQIAPQGDESHFLVLNSTALKNRAVHIINQSSYENIHLYLDNDKTGSETTSFFLDALGAVAEDKSIHYSSFKDLNEYLLSR